MNAKKQPESWRQDAVALCTAACVDMAVSAVGFFELDKFGSHLRVNFHITDIYDGMVKLPRATILLNF